jgi:hypothetical protein
MGLRIIKQTGICVSCAAREAEWRKGRNSKGTPPIRFVPLHEVEIAERAPDGRVRRRLVLALDMAEALGRVVRDLPQGARVVTGERCHTAWNHDTGRFHHVCEHCGAAGLVLERRRGDVLERHYWCCGGDPVGRGWDVAQVRQRVVSMPPEALADWLSARSELADEVPGLAAAARKDGLPLLAAAGLFAMPPTQLPLWAQVVVSMMLVVPLGPMIYRVAFQPVAEAPVLVVSRAGWPDQRVSEHQLGTLAEAATIHEDRPTIVTVGAGALPIRGEPDPAS